MPRKILVADLLCGAGGSSTGCARALADLGLEMELVCVNHWPIALETHARNHPQARHYCEDISTVRPHLIVPEGYLDLLMASPTCFPAGTLILTAQGLLPIEEVHVGARVLTHKGRWRTVTARMESQYDILFRMLEPHELAAAMGFDGADQAYEFAGTKTQKIKQIGNAVSVSKMKACVSAIMADAARPIDRRDGLIQRAAE